MKRYTFLIVQIIGIIIFSSFKSDNPKSLKPVKVSPDQDNAGLVLPKGFGALIVAENLGKARHLTVTPKGDIYVKLSKALNEKTIYHLKDNNGDGKVDEQIGFGDYIGTGIFLKNNYLYASSDEGVFRYQLNHNYEVITPDKPEKLVTGLINKRQHNTKSIVLDNNNNIYVNIGSPSNSCQYQNRAKGSMGIPNCPTLDSAGGIWQFKADKLNQSYKEGVRYATGLRNVMGLDWNPENNTLFVMQHGRDNLSSIFPDLYDDKANAELPAECMFMIKKGDNAGWPYSYYDPIQKKKILAPEYGGDGKKEADPSFIDPVVAFPAHLAPNALLFYTGNQFPERYKNGAFVAFHGSWNRAPLKQEGFFVAFVPFKNGKPSGEWEIFANNFAGTENITSTSQAKYRPCGLAQGPDGSLYISEDKKGTIFRIVYDGK
jgi:glucose/arabinose dehydrogenase